MSRKARLIGITALALFCLAMTAAVINAMLNPPKLPAPQALAPPNESSPLAESALSVQDFSVAPLMITLILSSDRCSWNLGVHRSRTGGSR
ncbi:MAG: hypothetical protein R3F37_16370 [Candidatus Competibacteraceae bacterium]